MPSRPLTKGREVLVGDNGKPVWKPLVQWTDRQSADRFSRSVIAAIRAAQGTPRADMSAASDVQQQAEPALIPPVRMQLQPGQLHPKRGALELAAAGVPVFPCDSLKAPLIPNGFLSASTDPAIVSRMFSTPWAVLIGMPTGPASGIDALDLDFRHGASTWVDANAWRLPETQTNETLHGGRHLAFIADPRVTHSGQDRTRRRCARHRRRT